MKGIKVLIKLIDIPTTKPSIHRQLHSLLFLVNFTILNFLNLCHHPCHILIDKNNLAHILVITPILNHK
jgi:hypothetical protein